MSSVNHKYKESSIKLDLLKETTRWKISSKKLINDVTHKLKCLKEAKASVKREINVKVARLEEQLRKLEQKALEEMRLAAEKEEATVKQHVRKLEERLKRVEKTESSLSDNIHSHMLTKRIQEGREQVCALKDSVLEINKQEIPTKAEFALIPTIANIFKDTKLGYTTFKSAAGVELTSTNTQSKSTDSRKAMVSNETLDDHGAEIIDDKEQDTTLNTSTTRTADIDEVNFHLHEDADVEDNTESTVLHDSETDKSTRLLDKRETEHKPTLARPKTTHPKRRWKTESNQKKDSENTEVRYIDYKPVKTVPVPKQSTTEKGNDSINKASSEYVPPVLDTDHEKVFIPSTVDSAAFSTAGAVLHKDRPMTQSYMKSYFQYKARFQTKQHTERSDLCCISGIVVMADGKVLVADLNHNQVMLHGTNLKYLYSLDCPSPYDISIVPQSNNIVAVSQCQGRKIILLKVFPIYLERHREVKPACNSRLYGLTCRADQLYVLCHQGDVHIIDRQGKPIQTVMSGISGGLIRYLEVDKDGKKIYLSGDSTVRCFQDTGQQLWQYIGMKAENKKFTPGGLVIYRQRLFVTDWQSHKVVELSPRGTHVRDVVIDNIEFPMAIGMLNSNGRIYITQSNTFKQEARSRSVKVFEIK